MSKVAIVTDSTACLPREVVSRYGIIVVPVELVFEGRVYRDGVDEVGNFYELLRSLPRLPTTSPSSPGTYLEAYRQASQRADEVLCITVSSAVSGMYNSAQRAEEMAREALPRTRIQIIDSQTAAMAQGFVVLAAARAAEAGDWDAAADAARAAIPRVALVAFLDTLDYLARGGRVPKAAAWAASVLQVKPVIQMRQGKIGLVSRTRTRVRALAKVMELAAMDIGDGPAEVAIVHADAAREAEVLRSQAAARLPCRELYITEFTPVMASHTGPGLLGLAYHVEPSTRAS